LNTRDDTNNSERQKSRCLLTISPRAADTLDTGAEPKTPAKNRVMKMDWAFLLVAVPIENNLLKN